MLRGRRRVRLGPFAAAFAALGCFSAAAARQGAEIGGDLSEEAVKSMIMGPVAVNEGGESERASANYTDIYL